MSKPTLSRSPAAAIPILMRLPDLRLSKSAGGLGQAVGADSATSVAALAAATESIETVAPAETVAESERSIEPEQATETVASGDGDSRASEATTVSAELPADAAAVPAPEIAEAVPEIAEPAAVVDETDANAVPVKPDVTKALPSDSLEPVAPAAARRQRALERQRRQVAEPPRQRTWWTTHLPVIAIGFLVALVLTIYVGRRNRATHANDSQASLALPELEIDTGDGSDSLSPGLPEPRALAVEQPDVATDVPVDLKPTVKSPPLLSAKPKATTPDELAPVENPRTAAKPSGNQSDITNPYVSARSAEGIPAAAELSSESAADYPSTEAAVYRPGGRPPREARAPNYPQTSTPHLR